MTLALALGWTATACVIGLNLPQVWRTVFRGLTAGVPVLRPWLAMAVSEVWFGYGAYGGGTVQIVLNGTTWLLNALLLTRLARTAPAGSSWWGAALCLAAAAAVRVLGQTLGLQAVGVLGALAAMVVYLPQALAARQADDVSGVSVVALRLQAASGWCWLGYGLLRAEAVVIVPNLVILAVTAWTLRSVSAGAAAARDPVSARMAS